MNKYEEAMFFFRYWSGRFRELSDGEKEMTPHLRAVFDRTQHWVAIIQEDMKEYLEEVGRRPLSQPQMRC